MKNRLAHLPRYLIFVPLILFIALLYGGVLQRFVPALAVGETHYTAAQFNYWFYECYLTYVDEHYDELDELGLDTGKALDKQERDDGSTWEDFFRRRAEDRLQEVEALLLLADDYGVSLKADDLPEYSVRLASAQAECEESGITLDDFAHSYYGYSVTAKNYQSQLLREVGADAVLKAITTSLEPGEPEIAAYAENHSELDNYLTADVRVIFFAPVKDRFSGETEAAQLDDMEAKSQLLVERWISKGGDEIAFAEMAARYSEDDTAVDGGLKKCVTKGELPNVLEDWLFDSTRIAGDITTSVTTDGVWIVYYCGSGQDASLLSARQILLDESVEALLDEKEQELPLIERFGMQIAM